MIAIIAMVAILAITAIIATVAIIAILAIIDIVAAVHGHRSGARQQRGIAGTWSSDSAHGSVPCNYSDGIGTPNPNPRDLLSLCL